MYRPPPEPRREEVVDEDVVDDLRMALVRCGAIEGDRFGRAPEEMGAALLEELRSAGYIDTPATFIRRPPTEQGEDADG